MTYVKEVAIYNLTSREKDIVFQSIRSILKENWIDNDEFQTRIGIGRPVLSKAVEAWPAINENDTHIIVAISNCMNEIRSGISIDKDTWDQHFEFTRHDLGQVFEKWRALLEIA